MEGIHITHHRTEHKNVHKQKAYMKTASKGVQNILGGFQLSSLSFDSSLALGCDVL